MLASPRRDPDARAACPDAAPTCSPRPGEIRMSTPLAHSAPTARSSPGARARCPGPDLTRRWSPAPAVPASRRHPLSWPRCLCSAYGGSWERGQIKRASEEVRQQRRPASSSTPPRKEDMACINMYNPDGAAGFGGGGPQAPAALGPRISFSSDFAVEPPPPPVQNRAMSLRCQEEDVNFEFSVGSHPMMATDQLFSKGWILPLKDNGGSGSCFAAVARPPTTLRDELRGGGGGGDERAPSASATSSKQGSAAASTSRWKEMLGLRKALCVSDGNGPTAKKPSSSDKQQGVAADPAGIMVTVTDDDMAASNQHQEL